MAKLIRKKGRGKTEERIKGKYYLHSEQQQNVKKKNRSKISKERRKQTRWMIQKKITEKICQTKDDKFKKRRT